MEESMSGMSEGQTKRGQEKGGKGNVPWPESAVSFPPVQEGADEAEWQRRLTESLNPVQKEAVLHERGPLLILAGAGSGKTRVITHRMAWLIRCRHVASERILAITFTNKAAREMKERLAALLGVSSGRMWVGTFHGMMLRILRRYAERLGFTADFSIYDVDDQLSLIRRIMKETGLDEKVMPEKQLLSRISAAKNQMETPEEMGKKAGYDLLKRHTAEIFLRYQAELTRQNAMDFDDILCHAVRLFQEHPDVLKAYQEWFEYVLVDEYQDTNHSQYLLVRLLSARHKNLCVVGDDDQSIYRFRGANLQNILDFEKDFKPCRVIKLEQNYRSTAGILSAANAVICRNTERKAKKLWTNEKEGDRLVFYRAQDQMDEGRFIAGEIRRLLRQRPHPLKANEVAILYRVNALSRNLEFALREEGIPYCIYGGLRFYDRKEIRDILAWLRLIESARDELALNRAVQAPKSGIGSTTMERLAQIAADESSSRLEIMGRAERYPELSRAAKKMRSFYELVGTLRSLRDENQMNFASFVEAVEEGSGLLPELRLQSAHAHEDAASRIENLKELLSDAMEFEAKLRDEAEQFEQMTEKDEWLAEGVRLGVMEAIPASEELSLSYLNRAFLEKSSLYSDLDDSVEEDAVSLMTIHSAKGLEFDAVFLAGAEDGLFPGYRANETLEELEEERRLAYVAITRAKKKLYFLAARSRLLYGQTRHNPVSRFVLEIPREQMRPLGGSLDESPVFPPSARTAEERGGWGDFAASSTRSYAWGSGMNKGKETSPGRFDRHDAAPTKAASSAGEYWQNRRGEEKDERRRSSLDVKNLKTGQLLHHERYGIGSITRVDPVLEDAILTIDFQGLPKRVMAKSALLTLPDGERSSK